MENIVRISVWMMLWVLSVLVLSCGNCDTVDPMPTAPLRFKIVDQNGTNLITDIGLRYFADSIQLFSGKENLKIYKEIEPAKDGVEFYSYPPNEASGKTELLLYLNYRDSDTITTFYDYHPNKCGSYYSYTGFIVNGKEVKKSPGGVISIIKPD